jgi:hypothetical protein
MRDLPSDEPQERPLIETMHPGRRETVAGSVPEKRVPILEHLPHDD